jgi:hypothetical protein
MVTEPFSDPRTEPVAGGPTIPPLTVLSRRFPEAAVVPLGLVTPSSHQHGPDENIDLHAAIRLTTALAELLAARTKR